MKINHGGHLIYQDTQIVRFTENKTKLESDWQRSGKRVPQIMGEVKEVKIGFTNEKIKRAQVRDLREGYIYRERERKRAYLHVS